MHSDRSHTKLSKGFTHSLSGGINGILGSDGTVKGIVRSAQVSHKTTSRKVTDILRGGQLLVRFAASQALFGGANVDLIVLELANLLQDLGDDPGAVANTSPLKTQGEDEKDVGDGTVQEEKREGRGGILPRDGGEDGGDDGALEAIVQESLGTIGNAEDIVALTRLDAEVGDGGDQEETGDHGELTSDHESREVASVAIEEEGAGLLAEEGVTTLGGGDLRDGEEGDLHALEHTNDAHEEEKEENGKAYRDTRVLDVNHGVSVDQAHQYHRHAKGKDGQGHDDAAPEERECESGLGLLVGEDGLARRDGHDVLDEIGRVHDAREFDAHGSVEGEEGEVVVDEVDHAVGGIDLGVELAENAGEDDHAQSNVQEDELDTVRHTEHIDFGVKGLAALVDNEDDHEHHELTSHEVTVEVVALEAQGAVLVGDRVAVLVQRGVDGGETDEGRLLSLDHGEPGDGQYLLGFG